MKHKFIWDKDKRELTEVRTGDELVDGQQKRVEGRYENKTIYPEATAIDMLKELKRQLHEAEVQEEQKLRRIAKIQKDKKSVDKVFYSKFKACIARDALDKLEEPIKAAKDVRDQIKDQIERLEEAMELKG